MSAKELFLQSLSNPQKLKKLLSDARFCASLSKEVTEIPSLFLDNASRAGDFAAQSFEVVLEKFSPSSESVDRLELEKATLDQEIIPLFLKAIIEKKVEKDGVAAMLQMLEDVGEYFRDLYLFILSKEKTPFAIFDQYIKEKPVPAEFFFSNSKKTSKSISPNARFSPNAALDGNAWQTSCSPSAKEKKKTIILQGSFFAKRGDEELLKLKAQIQRLIDEGFSIFGFVEDGLKKISPQDPLNDIFLKDLDLKTARKILAKSSIVKDESLILSSENADILNGVFYHSCDSINIADNFLQALFYKDRDIRVDIARNFTNLDSNQIELFEIYISTYLTSANTSDEEQKNLLSQILASAVLRDNKMLLELILKIAIENKDAPNGDNLILMLADSALACPNKVDLKLKTDLLDIIFNKKLPLPEYFLHKLTEFGDVKTLRHILKRKEEIGELATFIEKKNNFGETALMIAAQNGLVDVANLLLEKGAEIEARKNNGGTALIIAAYYGHKDVVELLLEKGAEIEAKNNKRHTALMFAERNGHKDVVRLLLDRGAEIDTSNGLETAAAIVKKSVAIYIATSKSDAVKYSSTTQTFQMLKAGKFLNLDKIALAETPRIRKEVCSEVKDGRFIRVPSELAEVLTQNLPLLAANFSEESIAGMTQNSDFGYAQLSSATKANSDLRLLGINHPYKIKAIRTNPEGVITSLTIDKDGFYHVQTSAKCVVEYVLEFDTKVAEIKGNQAVDFIEEYRKSCKEDADLPEKKPFATQEEHEKFLEAVYERKSSKTSCGLSVEVALHMMKKKGIDISNIKICRIDGNHVAFETKDKDGKIHYLEAGGVFGELIYKKEFYYKESGLADGDSAVSEVKVGVGTEVEAEVEVEKVKIPQSTNEEFALDSTDLRDLRSDSAMPNLPAENSIAVEVVNRARASFFRRFTSYLAKKILKRTDRKRVGPAEKVAENSMEEEGRVRFNPLFNESAETTLDDLANSETPTKFTPQHLLQSAKKQPKPLNIEEFSSSLKSPNFYICQNTNLLTNGIIKSLKSHAEKFSSSLGGATAPVFVLDNPSLLDLTCDKFKLDKSGKVIFDKAGFLADFLLAAEEFQRKLDRADSGDKITQADFNAAEFMPTLIINWSNFTAQQKVALNSLLDENPSLSEQSFSKIRIISIDNQTSQDSSFLNRHKEVYEITEQDLQTPPKQAVEAESAPVILCDLEGFDNWKATLFGDITLQNNQTIWQKSDFVKSLETSQSLAAAAKSTSATSFKITNSSNPQALEEFIARSYALGYLEYQGLRIALPENFSITIDNSPFNYAQFWQENRQHNFCRNCLLENAPNACHIVNQQLFDSLLFTKEISGGIYKEEAGLIAKAQDQTLQLFISTNLTNAQFYVLFNQAKKHNVKLELYLAPGIELPSGLNLPEFKLPKSPDFYDDKKIKSAIILTQNSRKIIAEVLQAEQEVEKTLAANKDILVINVEDFSYQDLISSTSYKINEDGSLSDFIEKESQFVETLKRGQRIILKGEFSQDLIEMLQPILLESYAQNLMLIIETPDSKIPAHLQFLTQDLRADSEKKDHKKPPIAEEFSPDISVQDFEIQREELFKNALSKNQMLHLTGVSGVGKSSLVEEFSTKNNIKLYSGLDSVLNFSKDKSDEEKILFIDESNIEDFHLTFLEELKRGETRFLYKGEILSLSPKHKIVFASNPMEYGGGRSLQKLFSDGKIQEIELQPMPQNYIMHLLMRDIFAKCTIPVKGIPRLFEESFEESFEEFCKTKIQEYNKKLASENPLTIRELQQEALLYLAAKSENALKYIKLSTANFISTTETKEIEEQILAAINLIKLQESQELPQAGTPGILLEGLPGMGKSVMLEAYLKKHFGEDSFIKISSSNSLEEKLKLIEQAYEEGKKLMIDELDASIDDGLEKVLNLALSNFHPNEAKQKQVREGELKIKPGFALFATSNGIELEGRKLISPAIRHRLKAPTKPAKKAQDSASAPQEEVCNEICEIIKSWISPINMGARRGDESYEKDIKSIATAFLAAKKESPEYSMRDLKDYCLKAFEESVKGLSPTSCQQLSAEKFASASAAIATH